MDFTLAVEGKVHLARDAFKQLLAQLPFNSMDAPIPQTLLLYAAYHNSAAIHLFLKQKPHAIKNWQKLAQRAQSSGNGLLFQLALQQLKPGSRHNPQKLDQAITVSGFRLGDRFTSQASTDTADEIWIEGEKFTLHKLPAGSHLVISDKGTVLNAWQTSSGIIANKHTTLVKLGDSADRPLKALGLPDRQHHLASGEYLAYDRYGLGLRIDRDRVQSWFLYDLNRNN